MGGWELGGGGTTKTTEKSVGLFQYVPSFLHVLRRNTKLAPEKKLFSGEPLLTIIVNAA
jgi:hypothetical protein